MYDRVLVPTDGSETAACAIDEAVSLAALAGASVHGLFVVDTRDYNALPETKWFTIEEELTEAGERALAAVSEAADDAGVPVETTIERGVPHRSILEYAEAADCDLVVMGTHGRSGLDRFLLGSVTEKVIRGASMPVHVVRATDVDGE